MHTDPPPPTPRGFTSLLFFSILDEFASLKLMVGPMFCSRCPCLYFRPCPFSSLSSPKLPKARPLFSMLLFSMPVKDFLCPKPCMSNATYQMYQDVPRHPVAFCSLQLAFSGCADPQSTIDMLRTTSQVT